MNVLIIDSATLTVVNVICADSVQRAREFFPGFECREQTGAAANAGPGWVLTADGWTPPAPVVAPAAPISPYDFLQRFTPAQRIAIRAAAKSDPVIEDAMGMLDKAPNVYLDDPVTVMFVTYLAQQGLIPSAAAILGGAQ